MSSINTMNRTQRETADQKLIDGLNKHSATLTSLVIGGATLKPSDVITTLQARITSAVDVESARATWQTAVQADRDQRAKTQTLVSGLRQAIGLAFAGSVDDLADFGLTPRKKANVSPETRVAAAAKGKATRKARGTLGKKQRLAITGAAATPTPAAPAAASPPPTAAKPSS